MVPQIHCQRFIPWELSGTPGLHTWVAREGPGQGLGAEAAWMRPSEAGVGSGHGGRSRANCQGSDEAKKIWEVPDTILLSPTGRLGESSWWDYKWGSRFWDLQTLASLRLVAKSWCHDANSCDAMDYSPPGSSVHGVSQARILGWLAISFSRGLTDPGTKLRYPALQADSLPTKPPGKLLASLRASNYTFQDSS